MPPERLQKILAAAGVASRRASEALIAAGRVTVDGAVATIGQLADPEEQSIAVDGRRIAAPAHERVHLALHKPPGVTSTVRDRHAGETVLDLVPPELRAAGVRLYPVGRLDRDSEGLLLLTDDGPWADRLLHPRYGVEREYAVAADRPLDGGQARALGEGIELEEGVAVLLGLRPATGIETRRLLGLLPDSPRDRDALARLAWYRVVIGQGWRRQLRRMFGAVDAPVRRLVRVRVGSLRLDELRSGECRPLTAREVRQLGAVRPSGNARGGREPH